MIRRSALLALSLTVGNIAHAKSQADLEWPLEQVVSAALRFVRVDRGCKIVDKDEQAAFLVFECTASEGHGRPEVTRRGSLELFRVPARGREVIRAQVTLGDEPRYVELRFLELFERKLRDERGAPAPPTATTPTRARPTDGGAP